MVRANDDAQSKRQNPSSLGAHAARVRGLRRRPFSSSKDYFESTHASRVRPQGLSQGLNSMPLSFGGRLANQWKQKRQKGQRKQKRIVFFALFAFFVSRDFSQQPSS
jgi:hypothetical protein